MPKLKTLIPAEVHRIVLKQQYMVTTKPISINPEHRPKRDKELDRDNSIDGNSTSNKIAEDLVANEDTHSDEPAIETGSPKLCPRLF